MRKPKPRPVQLIIRVPPELRDAVNEQAATEDTTAAQWLRAAIKAQLRYAQIMRGEP